MKPVESSSFCVVPWLHHLVNERGFFKVCCVAEGQENFLIDSAGKRIHIQGEQSENEIFNSPRLKEIRREIINWLLASKGDRKVTLTKKLVLPDIEPEDLSIPRTVFNRRKTPLRRNEVKRETVEVE